MIETTDEPLSEHYHGITRYTRTTPMELDPQRPDGRCIVQISLEFETRQLATLFMHGLSWLIRPAPRPPMEKTDALVVDSLPAQPAVRPGGLGRLGFRGSVRP